jgi:phospholipid/cholesterol/gamma-HCH transport system substrate-binding protein
METRSNYILVGAVTLAMLVGALAFTVWLAGLSGRETKCYDIYFAQAVGGLNRGSNVSYSGVPVGQITQISLMPERPEFVHVKIEVQAETPVVRGTTAEIRGVGFTGVSEIQLTGGARGAQPLTNPGPQGCPVIPSSTSGLGALLNNAPELMERIQRLTERLTELLSDENQNAIADILENVRQTTGVLRARAPEFADAVADARIAARNAGIAAERFAALAETTNSLVVEEGRPAAQDLRRAIAGVERARRTWTRWWATRARAYSSLPRERCPS